MNTSAILYGLLAVAIVIYSARLMLDPGFLKQMRTATTPRFGVDMIVWLGIMVIIPLTVVFHWPIAVVLPTVMILAMLFLAYKAFTG